jgi:transcriptional regulator
MGSHGYVSPSMYLSRPNVPTWNYATVHAKGTLEIVEDSVAVVEHLRDMIHFFDPTLIDTHPEALEWDYVERISKGVVVFKMAVSTLEAKHKMNQNKSQEDRTSVISCLVETQEPDQQALASWMQHWADPNPSGP